jgi:hypothetical protein
VIFEQGIIGSRFNYGTVIPQNTTSRDVPPLFGWIMALSGLKANAVPGTGSAGSIGTSRDPLNCLFGIPDPKNARYIIEKMMYRPAVNED